jgi:hypothetical protein
MVQNFLLEKKRKLIKKMMMKKIKMVIHRQIAFPKTSPTMINIFRRKKNCFKEFWTGRIGGKEFMKKWRKKKVRKNKNTFKI